MDSSDELPRNAEFDHWCYSAQDERVLFDDGRPLPVLTVALYRICNNEEQRFQELLRALQVAFEAGQAANKK